MVDEFNLEISNPTEGNFLKKIAWNKEEITEAVTEIINRYDGLVYTEDQIKLAKEDRAKLNATKKSIEAKRIEVKKALMIPYDTFEAEVKEVVALIDKPINMIDKQIKQYEEKTKEEKKNTLMEYFKQISTELENIITFDTIFEQKYLNVSVSLKQAKECIKGKVEKIQMDLKSIDEICNERYITIVKDVYIRTLDISKAMAEESRLRELDRKLEEERQRKEEEERKKIEEATRIRGCITGINPNGNCVCCGDNGVKCCSECKEACNGRCGWLEDETVLKTSETVPNLPKTTSNVNEQVTESISNTQKQAEAIDPFAPQEKEKMFKATFTAYGTRKQLEGLRQYMINNHIRFGK